jgi:hypothetical protein
MSYEILGSKQFMTLILDGLKVVEEIAYLDTNFLYNIIIKPHCVVMNVIKILDGEIQLLHASRGVEK